MQALGMQQVNENLKITSYTKLMEHLDVCGANDYASQEGPLIKEIQGDIKEVQAIRDGNGCDHVFANNPVKGMIYYYLGDKFIHANGRPVPLYGKKMTAGIDKNGVVHIFALRDNKIYTSKETSPFSGKFTEEAAYDTTSPKDFESISQISVVQMQQGFALFVVSETSHKDAFVSYRCDDEQYDYLMPVAFATGEFVFSGSSKESLCVHQVYANKYESFYSTCCVSGKCPDIHSLEFSSRGLAANIFISGQEVFCCDDRSHLWKLSASSEGIKLTDLAQLGEEGCIGLQKSAETIHAVSIDKNRRLVHLKATASEATAPFPIDTDVGAVCFCPQADTATLYYYDQAAASMIQLSYNVSGQNWKEMSLALPDPETIQRYPCYSTELTLLNPKTETPLIEVDVQVWTEERTYIKVGECFYICDKEHKIDLKTDIRGKIIVVQYTNKIDACVIYASLPEHLLSANQCLAFRQFETVSGKMEKVTSNDILNAKTTDSMGSGQGNLLSDQYRTEKNAEAIAQSIQKLMSLNSIRNNCPTCKGTYIIDKTEIGTLNRIFADDPLPCWSLRVEGNSVIYRDLEDSEAQERIRKIKAESISLTPREFDGFFSAIGDFFRGIVKKIVQVVEVIIKGIKTVVQFVIDSVTFVFEFVAKVIGGGVWILLRLYLLQLWCFLWLFLRGLPHFFSGMM